MRFKEERLGAVELEMADWIQTVEVSDLTAVELLRERLDRGEGEAIVLAIETESYIAHSNVALKGSCCVGLLLRGNFLKDTFYSV